MAFRYFFPHDDTVVAATVVVMVVVAVVVVIVVVAVFVVIIVVEEALLVLLVGEVILVLMFSVVMRVVLISAEPGTVGVVEAKGALVEVVELSEVAVVVALAEAAVVALEDMELEEAVEPVAAEGGGVRALAGIITGSKSIVISLVICFIIGIISLIMIKRVFIITILSRSSWTDARAEATVSRADSREVTWVNV